MRWRLATNFDQPVTTAVIANHNGQNRLTGEVVMGTPHRVVIAGGGFGGVYTAIELDKRLANDPNVEITLISHENFILFTPMLHEVAASDLDLTTIVNPIRKLLRKVNFIAG